MVAGKHGDLLSKSVGFGLITLGLVAAGHQCCGASAAAAAHRCIDAAAEPVGSVTDVHRCVDAGAYIADTSMRDYTQRSKLYLELSQ